MENQSDLQPGEITPEGITEEMESLLNEIEGKSTEQNFGLLKIKSANQVMEEAKQLPIPKMLFDKFWREGELCVMFADTGVGKSILAVQIGVSIASGIPIPGFLMECDPQPVYYFDFELGIKQFEKRYSNNFENGYEFPDNFFRGELTLEEVPAGRNFDEYLMECLKNAILTTNAKVLIIDNLTRLTQFDTDKARDAKPMMENLMRFKMEYKISMLALEHTRKRDESKEISLNDLQGSAMKMRFFDEAFTIGRSQQDKNTRYLKQMKTRDGEAIFDTENVAVCMIHNPLNFTQFEFRKTSSEHEHLKIYSDNEREKRDEEIANLKRQGMNNSEIARQMGISEGTVRNRLKKLENPQ